MFARRLATRSSIFARTPRLPLPPGEVLITTDGFTVQPLEFPGGDIGSLAVHGTVNDLAVAGATPLYLSLNAFIEEGFEFAQLDRLIASMARAAASCGVRVVAGDTKVLRRGEGGGLYLATTGIGVRAAGPAPRHRPDIAAATDAGQRAGRRPRHGRAALIRSPTAWALLKTGL